MKRFNKICLALALAMTVIALLIPAWSYFTTYAVARGGHPLQMEDKTEIKEDFANWTKTLQITNHSDSVYVFVRAKAITSDNIELAYNGEGWKLSEEGYYEYTETLEPGGKTKPLNVVITPPKAEDTEEGDKFYVYVVYQSVNAKFEADGTPYADWDHEVQTITQEGGN